MATNVKIEDGYIVERDEYGNHIRTYGYPNTTQILAVSGNRVAAFSGDSELGGTLQLYNDGNIMYNIPVNAVENVQISSNILIIRFKNGHTSEYDERGNHLNTYYST